jgi:flagellar basal body rod protein FlgC
MQWLQDIDESNAANLNSVRHDTGRYFRNKKRVYLKCKINEIETNSKTKNIKRLVKGHKCI